MGIQLTVNQSAMSVNGSGANYGPDPSRDPGMVEKLKDVTDAIAAGLKAEADRISAAQANSAFYRLENKNYINKREAETDADFAFRPKRTSKLTRAAINKLASKLYSPGPSRSFITEAEIPAEDDEAEDDDEPEGQIAQWLADAYAKAKVNVVLDSANRRAVLNDCCAIQVSCTGDPARPIQFYTFDAYEFAVFFTAENPTEPWAVVTISVETSSLGKKRRVYKLWTAEVIQVYKTKEVATSETTGGIIAKLDSSSANPYGVLPFAFYHNETPVDRFWGSGIGCALRETNQDVDRSLSDLAQQIQIFSCPDMFVRGVPTEFRYNKTPGRPQLLKSTSQALDGDNTITPEFFYVQPTLAIEQIWSDIEKYVNQTFFELNIPLNYSRETNAPTSGVQVIAESAPFLDYLRTREIVSGQVEQDLVKVVLACSGNFYGLPFLLDAAEDIKVDLVWPEPAMPVPTPEADATDQWELSYGLASPIQIMMRRRGITRKQAVAMAKQVQEDTKLWEKLFPSQTPGSPIMPPPAAKPDNPFLSGDGSGGESDTATMDEEATGEGES